MNFFLFVIINYASINESIFLLYQSQLIYKVTRIRLILIHFFPMHPFPLSQCILFPKSLVFKTDKTALKNGHEEENRQSKKWRLWILWKSYSPPIRHIFLKKKETYGWTIRFSYYILSEKFFGCLLTDKSLKMLILCIFFLTIPGYNLA